MDYEKKKDANPLDTLSKIRGILDELEVFTIETWKYPYRNNEDYRSHSVRVDLPSCGLGTNGKGTSRLYTLASAYAELLERMQNLILFPKFNLSEESLEECGFSYFPDEQKLSMEDILHAEDSFTKTAFADFYSDSPWMLEIGAQEKEKAIHAFDAYSGRREDNASYVGWPFYSVKLKKPVPVWNGLVMALQGSNGMSAGNTPQEALVQGLAEVFERYASIEIMQKRIVPPDMPKEEYSAYTAICDMVAEIEGMGPYKILFKDCSLGLGIPVCAAALIDEEKHRYRVSFGCHPSLPVVLERCLTELLQGYDMASDEDRDFCLIPFERWNSETDDVFVNTRNQHINGHGKFPPSFFAGKPSYPHRPFPDFSSAGNDEMQQHFLTAALSLSDDVLIRDVSYLGFPAYFILMPGVSHFRTGWKTLQAESAYNFLRSVHSLNKNELGEKEIKKLLIGLNMREQSSGKQALPFDACRLKLAALLQLKNYDGCIQYIDNLLPHLQEGELLTELKAMGYVVSLIKEGKDLSEAEQPLSLFFGDGMWEQLQANWLTGQPVKSILQKSAESLDPERQMEINRLFCRVKRRFSENRIDQKALGDVVAPHSPPMEGCRR